MPEEPHIPERLARDLRALEPSREAPPQLDDLVLASARRRLAPRRPLVRIGAGLAAAAALLLAVSLLVLTPGGRRGTPLAAANPRDINGDGVVDILDALALARFVERGEPGADLTGDGRTTSEDVEALALAVVSLDRSEG